MSMEININLLYGLKTMLMLQVVAEEFYLRIDLVTIRNNEFMYFVIKSL